MRKLITIPQWWVNWQQKFTKLINETHNLSPKYTKKKGEDRLGMTIKIKVTFGLEIDPLIETEGHYIELKVDSDKIMARSLGRTIEGDHRTVTEMMWGVIAIEVKIIEIEAEAETVTETIIGMTIDGTIILVGIEVGQEKDPL